MGYLRITTTPTTATAATTTSRSLARPTPNTRSSTHTAHIPARHGLPASRTHTRVHTAYADGRTGGWAHAAHGAYQCLAFVCELEFPIPAVRNGDVRPHDVVKVHQNGCIYSWNGDAWDLVAGLPTAASRPIPHRIVHGLAASVCTGSGTVRHHTVTDGTGVQPIGGHGSSRGGQRLCGHTAAD